MLSTFFLLSSCLLPASFLLEILVYYLLSLLYALFYTGYLYLPATQLLSPLSCTVLSCPYPLYPILSRLILFSCLPRRVELHALHTPYIQYTLCTL